MSGMARLFTTPGSLAEPPPRLALRLGICQPRAACRAPGRAGAAGAQARNIGGNETAPRAAEVAIGDVPNGSRSRFCRSR